MTSIPDSGGSRPASMFDRIVARAVDLFLTGALFGVLALAIALFVSVAHSLVSWGGASGGITWNDLLEAWHLFAFALVVAFIYEPASLVGKGTRGKIATNLELRCALRPDQLASPRRAVGRFGVSVVACGVSIGLTLAGSAVAGMDWTPWRVVGLVAIPTAAAWVSVLVSALFRADRRGWHDLVAGTVLVSRSVPPPRRRQFKGTSGVGHPRGRRDSNPPVNPGDGR